MLRSYVFPSSAIKWAVRAMLVTYVPHRVCTQGIRPDFAVVDSEILDRFIDTLMTNKMNKWRARKEANCTNGKEFAISDDVSRTSAEVTSDFTCLSIDDYVSKHLKSPHLHSILKVCQVKEVSPSPETLIKVACVFARSGNRSGIETIFSLSDFGNACDEKKKEEFRVFQAEAMWRGGESIQKSLAILHEVYKTQPGLRRFVRSSLRSLIGEVVQCRGEAALVQVKDLVLQLADPPYEDATPLSFLWGQCILSEWFADQQMSVEIVTMFIDSPKFMKALKMRLDAVVGQALSSHQVEAVYRVLETLLRLSMDKPAEAVLGKLFDYKYIMGDRIGCEAILELCATTDLNVGSTRRKQFESAPAKWKNRRNVIVARESLEKLKDHPRIIPVPKFKFKL